MVKKIVLAGILGGVVMFLWGALSHMVLPLGEVGIKQFANDEPILAAMKENIKESGLYFFPGMEPSPNMTKEQKQAAQKKWEEKYRQGPRGILIYHPEGEQPLSPKQLVTELINDMIVMMLAAFFLAQAMGGLTGFGTRVFFVTLLGLFARLVNDVSYWNWYGFPGNFTLASMADDVIGFFLAGFVLAAMVKKPTA